MLFILPQYYFFTYYYSYHRNLYLQYARADTMDSVGINLDGDDASDGDAVMLTPYRQMPPENNIVYCTT